MAVWDELREHAARLDAVASEGDGPAIAGPVRALMESCAEVAASASGSWLGYHSRVYYRDFQAPPAGARFSPEWGFIATQFIPGTRGDWVEYSQHDVVRAIETLAETPDLSAAEAHSERARRAFEEGKAVLTSILTTELQARDDSYVRQVLEEIQATAPLTQDMVASLQAPRGHILTRDMTAMSQGQLAPPHVVYVAHLIEIVDPGRRCRELGEVARRVGDHLERVAGVLGTPAEALRSGTRAGIPVIFIGHGRSSLWRTLKDFIAGRLQLDWDEFNRISPAGIGTIDRLRTMLDRASFAFLVLTAEDAHEDGTQHARENVIHEAGLFQGRLGFERAIILLEEGCEEFSNIEGLGQIRFPGGRIDAAFEEIRLVLEREGLI